MRLSSNAVPSIIMITHSRDQCHVPWELENDGCESEFIVGSFDNRICVCAQVKFES